MEEEIIQGTNAVTEQDEERIALDFLRGLQMFASEHYSKPEFTLYQNGVGFAPLGNLMAICAEMKSGKTWLMLQLAATLLMSNHQFFCLQSSEIPDMRVLWLDTEQDKYDSMLIMRRIHQLCGWRYDEENPKFQMYNLRSIRHDERLKALRMMVKHLHPTVIFLDGIRDLVGSFNDENESFSLIEELMQITEQYHCSIWSVLHVNPNSEKMRGHLGTELGNKVTDVFSVKKVKDLDGSIYFSVNQVAARHRDVDGWKFRIADMDFPRYSVPVIMTATEAKDVNEEHLAKIKEIMVKYVPRPGSISLTKLREEIKKGERCGTETAKKMIKEAAEEGFIEKAINGKYTLIDKPIVRTSELPFEEVENDVPF